MKDPAVFRRTAAAVGLVTAGGLAAISALTQPEFSGGPVERLTAISDAGTVATVSALAFTLAQLPFLVAVLGVAHVVRGGAPVLSNLGATLGVIGGFGHAVFGGFSLVLLAMAADPDHLDVHADVVSAVESGPAAAFVAMGLIGTVLGLVLLAAAWWRAGVGPRWVPPVLALFLVVEFVGTSLSAWASYAAAALYLLSFVGMAVTVWRTPRTAWTTSGEAEPQPSPSEAAPQR